MSSATRWLVAGLGASAATLALWALGAGPVVALGVGAGAFFVLRLAMPDRGRKERQQRWAIDDAKRDLRTRGARFDQLAQRVKPPELAQTVRRIGQLVRDLVQHVDRDAANLERIEGFVAGELPKAFEIVERYALLSGQDHLDDRARGELESSAETIALIERVLEEQHRRLLASDVRELTIDRRVFEELLELDGRLGEESASPSRTAEDRIRE